MITAYRPKGADVAITTRYPRELSLRDQRTLTITPLVPSDWPMLEEFLKAIPNEEHRFFRRNLSGQQRVRRWCSERDYSRSLPLLAWEGSHIVADVTLLREPDSWRSHVGTLRLLVRPDNRNQGIGVAMLDEIIALAGELGLRKLQHECAATQTSLIHFLERSGFRGEAVLREFIRDPQGQLHDMVIMAMDV